jgi:acylphosphatase
MNAEQKRSWLVCIIKTVQLFSVPPWWIFVTSNEMIAKRYIVSGRVQGVGFRWFVDHEARQLGLSGWVRNNIDGSVEVLAIGSPQQHAALRDKLQRGPRAARVDEVKELPADPVPGLNTFRIEGAW